MLYAMISITAEIMRDNGRSKLGGAGGSADVEESPADVGTIAAGETPRGAVTLLGYNYCCCCCCCC